MINPWQILPSPRPLLIWLGVDTLGALALALLALGLLALWRRPARVWRLGMAALVASWLAGMAALWVLRAYNEVKHFTTCGTPDDCANTTQMIAGAVTGAGVAGSALAVATLVALLAATILPALEARRIAEVERMAQMVAEDWLARIRGLAVGDLLATCGALLLAQGILDWIEFAPLADPARSGDGIGEIPLLNGIVFTFAGAALFGFGLVMLLRLTGALTLRRRTRAIERTA